MGTNMPRRHDRRLAYLPLACIVMLGLYSGCASRSPARNLTQPLSADTRPGLLASQATGITSSGATITWTTDKPSSGTVQWGKTADYEFAAQPDGDVATQQSVILNGLRPDTEYHYRIKLPDLRSTRAIGPDQTFRTLEQLYASPLAISDVGISKATGSMVTVKWTTSVPSSGRVEYGVTGLYGSSTAPDNCCFINHSIDLGPLSPGITYHYRAVSQDKNGNEAASGDQLLTNPASSDGSAAVISDISIAKITHLSAAVSWVSTGLAPSHVEYSTDLSYSTSTPPEMGRVHTAILDNLDDSTAYHFRIKVADSAGNVSTSPDVMFVTATAPRMQGFSPYTHNRCACHGR
jgi:hypothetical protein